MPPKKQANADGSLESRYAQLVARRHIKDDAAQRQVLTALEALSAQLKPRRGLFKKQATRGLYIWGNVGRGKSMLMDLFYDHVPVKKKRRIHFHAFMQEVHMRIHKLRKEKLTDPVAVLAQQLAEETTLLCFDELQANDVADATLLYRLFSGLFEADVMIVSTSNHPPASLYTGGHQRERFAKFITLIEECMQVMALSSPADYRQMQMKSEQRAYFYPLGPDADAFIDHMLKHLAVGAQRVETLAVHGRVTFFALYKDAIGRFTFQELCESALGAADYLALAERLDTLIVTDIPKLAADKRNEAKRFMTLVDALYEHKVKLIATADVAPDQLYPDGDGAFEFKRTASRLAEMQSEKYSGK